MRANRLYRPIIMITIMALLLAACAQPDLLVVPDTGGTGSQVMGYSDLIAGLSAAGATVEEGNAVNQPFFDVPGRIVTINGADVQVFEFADQATREAASAKIAADAGVIAEFMPNWIDQASFWANGNLIALYVGRDDALKKLLSDLLGSPVAQSQNVESSLQGDQAAFEAQRQLAQRFGAQAEDVIIKVVESVEWSDSCLGVTGDNLACAQVITPGWRVTLSFDGRDYEARTNQTASVVRFPALP